ncbi:MAG: twin-arginine translocase TatA/TatE family subunit [Nautiliaceae bacterium]
MLKFLKKGLKMIGTWQIVAILVVVLLLFGGKKIPELAQGLGKGIKNFKDAVKDEENADKADIKKVEAENKKETPKEKEINA